MGLAWCNLLQCRLPVTPCAVDVRSKSGMMCSVSATLPLCTSTSVKGISCHFDGATASKKPISMSLMIGGGPGGRGLLERFGVDHCRPDPARRIAEEGHTNIAQLKWEHKMVMEEEIQQQRVTSMQGKRKDEDVRADSSANSHQSISPFGLQRCSSFEPEAVDNASTSCNQQARPHGRRQALTRVLLSSTAVLLTYMPGKVLAADSKEGDVVKEQNVLGGLLSIFDPDETTKLGKKLPKAYLKSARVVVQTLRDSFSEDSKNDAKFRRNADSAKGAIREYIANWRGAKVVAAEESYQALERALRVLGEFYSKKGPTAVLPDDVRVQVLTDLQLADNAL